MDRYRCMMLLLTAMTISAVLILVSAGKGVERRKSAAAARQAGMQERAPVGYVLREYEGHLALYRENGIRPYRVLDTEVWLLPEEDRAALENGILLETEQELRQLLEDWDS